MKKQPNPATAHTQSRQCGVQTTSRSSALVRGRSTQFIANPCRWPQRPCPETRLHFCHFCGFFSFNPGFCPSRPRCLCFRGGCVILPYSLESARAAYFHFRQWFTCVIFSCDLFDPLNIVLEDLSLPSDVPPVVLLFCVRFPLSMSFSAFRISSVRRLVHLV